MLMCKTFYLQNCSTGAVRHTAKSNLFDENEIKKIIATIFMGNPDHGATAINFIVEYNKFVNIFKCS